VSSLRDDIAKLLSETNISGDEYIWATDAIMLAIDSHIPEKRAYGSHDTLVRAQAYGFNEAVDLMREEIK
jgi:hypothetical protein